MMQTPIAALLSLLISTTAQAAVSSCEPFEISSANSQICGPLEVEAATAARRAGLLADIQKAKHSPDQECEVSPSQAIRLSVAAGNRGKDVQVLVLTKMVCKSRFFVPMPIHQFPILVTLWSNHEETEFAGVEAQKLYSLGY